jgi:hypothetical protein
MVMGKVKRGSLAGVIGIGEVVFHGAPRSGDRGKKPIIALTDVRIIYYNPNIWSGDVRI